MQGNSALVGYFTVAEVGCHHCWLACVKRELLSALFKLARTTDRGRLWTRIAAQHTNQAVRGAPDSQHMLGLGSRPTPASAARTPASAARGSAGSARLLAGSRAARRRRGGCVGCWTHAGEARPADRRRVT